MVVEEADLKYQQHIDVFRELFIDDVYQAHRVFDEGDLWLDIGCHTGWFSWLAIAHGSAVVGGVDCDIEALQTYVGAIAHSMSFCSLIENHEQLQQAFDAFVIENRGFNSVKMDIQGGERFLLSGRGMEPFHSPAGSAIDKLLLEWHYPERLPELITTLENDVFNVELVERHEDVLTREDTHIVFATRKPFTS